MAFCLVGDTIRTCVSTKASINSAVSASSLLASVVVPTTAGGKHVATMLMMSSWPIKGGGKEADLER